MRHVYWMTWRLERVMGIEPTWPAWKAGALPLSYTRTERNTNGRSLIVNCPGILALWTFVLHLSDRFRPSLAALLRDAATRSQANQPRNFFAAMLALWPPKPNELFTMALTFNSRGVLGT